MTSDTRKQATRREKDYLARLWNLGWHQGGERWLLLNFPQDAGIAREGNWGLGVGELLG